MSHRPNPTPREVERMLRTALADVAADLPEGAPDHIDRLTLRLQRGAGPADVSRELRRALPHTGGSAGKEST